MARKRLKPMDAKTRAVLGKNLDVLLGRRPEPVALIPADWQEQFAEQNRLLAEIGDEPLTPVEFLSCRLEDAEVALAAVANVVKKWRGTKTVGLLLSDIEAALKTR